MKSDPVIRPGDVIALTERGSFGHLDAFHHFIVWDPAVDGDPLRWLVVQAEIPHKEKSYQPLGYTDMIIQADPQNNRWESITPHQPAKGRLPVGDYIDGVFITGHRYMAGDEGASGIIAMTAASRKHLAQLTANTHQQLSEAGVRRAMLKDQVQAEMEIITEYVKQAAAQEIPETVIAGLARIDRMTVRKILSKQ